MADEWFVRVQGREYGPVDLETLRDWRREGRLIADNELRNVSETMWSKAMSMPEIFAESPAQTAPPSYIHPRSFAQVINETFRIYARGFLTFVSLALLVAIPSLVMQLCLPYFHLGETQPASPVALTVAVLATAFFFVLWPIFVTGFQIAGAEIAAGNRVRLRNVLQRTAAFWPKMARLCLIVYGSYFLWSVVPVLAIISLVARLPSVLGIFLALGILALQVFMTARLWVNFMFWQQFRVLDETTTLETLRESQRLARSGASAPWHERPLWRGAILVSIWLVVLFVVSGIAQIPFTLVRLPTIANSGDAMPTLQSLMEKMTSSPAPLWITIASITVGTLVNALLRPLLAIVFLVLYFDAKARTNL